MISYCTISSPHTRQAYQCCPLCLGKVDPESLRDPLTCPNCGTEMRFLAVIEEAPVIEQILRHIGVWDPRPPLRASPAEDDWPQNGQMPLTYGPLPDIA